MNAQDVKAVVKGLNAEVRGKALRAEARQGEKLIKAVCATEDLAITYLTVDLGVALNVEQLAVLKRWYHVAVPKEKTMVQYVTQFAKISDEILINLLAARGIKVVIPA